MSIFDYLKNNISYNLSVATERGIYGLKSVAAMCDGLKSIPTISVEPTALNKLAKTHSTEGCYKAFVAGVAVLGALV